jgi:phosphoglucosamine mutase
MYPNNIANLVRQHRADVGICLDGDADRLIMLDSNGAVVNGDRLLAMCAIDKKERGVLTNNTLVTTVMSNLGLKHAMKREGINVETTDVGDRYVIERMRAGGFNIGGEQSGHIIFMDYVTTGDGIISALHILRRMLRKQKDLSELANCMEEFPQVLKNIRVKNKLPIKEVAELDSIIKKCEKELGDNGRVLVRYSGTENLMRIMIEAKKYKIAESWAKKIIRVAEKNLS